MIKQNNRTMRYIKSTILLFCFLLTATMLQAKAKQPTATKETNLLLDQCERQRIKSDYAALAQSSRALVSSARHDGNERGVAYGLFYQGLSDLFLGAGSQAEKTLNMALEKGRELNNDSIGALAMNALGIYQAQVANNSFLAQQMFFKALQLAERAPYEQLANRIYGNMLILGNSSRDTTGLSNARRIYDYGRKHHDRENVFMGAYYLALYYNLQVKNQEAERYIREALDIYKQNPYDDVASVYILYSRVKDGMGHRAEALSLAREGVTLAEKYPQAGVLPDAYLQLAQVLHEQGDYATSDQMARRALDYARQYAVHSKKVDCYDLIARNALKLGRQDDAIDYLLKANTLMDTLTRVNMDRLMHERTIMMARDEQERKAVEQEQQLSFHYKLTALMAIIAGMLLVLLAVLWYYYRQKGRLYKSIVVTNARYVQQIKSLEDRLTPNKLTDDDQRTQDLYDRACQLMTEKRVFKDPTLSRERLAEMLGTNRTYLSQAIKEKGGMNYQQFVNSYRINEAIRLFSDPSTKDYPLKQIWSDLGFSSPSTFYKLFQQAVGITPSAYRKQAAELDAPVEDEESL